MIDITVFASDFITSILSIDKEEQQKILEITNVRHRMEQILVFIKKEQELLRVQKKVQMELLFLILFVEILKKENI